MPSSKVTREALQSGLEGGLSFTEIGDRCGVTRERVRQLANEWGLYELRWAPIQAPASVALKAWLWADQAAYRYRHRPSATFEIIKHKLDPIVARDIEVLPDGCWKWLGCFYETGYPRLSCDRFAHRETYEALYGPVARGSRLKNLCGDVSCPNPEHWRAMTHRELSSLPRRKRNPVESLPRSA
jgi:hypothetical protein